MGIPGEVSSGMIAPGQAPGYSIARSLRFRSSASAFLSRTPTVAGSRTTWTWSGWVKKSQINPATQPMLFSSSSGSSVCQLLFQISAFGTADAISFYDGLSGPVNLTTTSVYRDASAWYHIVLAVDTTQATSTNRVKIYVNGVQLTAFGTASYPTQNQQLGINSQVTHGIGAQFSNGVNQNQYFDGYMTEINFVDGQALTPASFGSLNQSTGIWQPIKYAGTYGTNGFYLNFSDNSGLTSLSNTGLGRDFSGNGNFWATQNISLATATTIQSFTSVATTSWTAPAGVTSVNYLVVAGGGGGGTNNGGGGGGGGVLQGTANVIPGQTYSVTVGGGGTAGSSGGNGSNGSNSSFVGPGIGIVSLGGGGGAGNLTSIGVPQGNSGGSGGGGSGGETGIATGSTGGLGTTGQGFAGGGPGLVSVPLVQRAGAGGGGAGAIGNGATNAFTAGAGGIGTVSSISGTATFYGGGGGGGAQWDSGTAVGGSGGLGGGGAGASVSNASTTPVAVASVAGTANTGGGGGAQARSANSSASNGGSGIVILAYTLPGTAATYDSMIDSPTLSSQSSNYCTMNPLQSRFTPATDQLATYSNANLQTTISSGGTANVMGTMGFNSGAYYFEVTVLGLGGANGTIIGIGPIGTSYAGVFGQRNDGSTVGTTIAGAPFPFYVNDVIGIAFDLGAGTCSWYQNGTFKLTVSFTPSNYRNWSAWSQMNFGGDSLAWNFGQRPFNYTAPSGYLTMAAWNIPSSLINNGNAFVNAITYTGGALNPPNLGQVAKRNAGNLVVTSSLRFNRANSAFLQRTPTAVGNRNTFTWSGWVKRGQLTTGVYYQLFGAGTAAGGNDGLFIDTNGGGLYFTMDAGTNAIVTTQVLQDASAWYHVMVSVDTTQTVPANRVIFYINGQQQTYVYTVGGSGYPPLNTAATYINTLNTHRIGNHTNTSMNLDGYLAEVNFIDGQRLQPGLFGTSNSDGIWVPIPYTGTYGTNGFRLPFTPSTASTFSGSFNGSSQWVSTPISPTFNLAASDWTVEGWYYMTNVNSGNSRYMVFIPSLTYTSDTSTNNATMAVTNSPSWNQLSPYNNLPVTGGSMWLNGVDQYLTVSQAVGNLGTGDWTVELWWQANSTQTNFAAFIGQGFIAPTTQGMWAFKPNGGGTNTLQFSYADGGSITDINVTGSTPNDGRWHHIAASRQGSTLRIFQDGVLLSTSTLPGGYSFGVGSGTATFIGYQSRDNAYIKGNLTNIRVVQGTALYIASFTPPSSELTAVSGTQLLMLTATSSSIYADGSANNYAVTAINRIPWSFSSPIATAVLGGSIAFNGTNTSAQTGGSPFLYGSNNFTVETWIYPFDITNFQYIASVWGVAGQADNTFSSWQLRINTSGQFEAILNNGSANTTLAGTGQKVLLRQWQHVALVRNGTTITIFWNGINIGSTTYTSSLNNVPSQFVVGQQLTSLYYLNALISNMRIVNGTAVYTAPYFTPPTAPLTAIPGTVLLLSAASSYGYISDSSINNIRFTLAGSLAWNPASPFAPISQGSSTFFNGSNDNVAVANNSISVFTLPSQTTPFTVECWVYPTTQLNATSIISGGFYGSNDIPFAMGGATTYNASGSGLYVGFYDNGSATWQGIQTTTSLQLNIWSHLAASYDGSTMRLYLNGSLIGTYSGGWSQSSITQALIIGRRWDTSGSQPYFPGYITSVRYVIGTAIYSGNAVAVPTSTLAITGAGTVVTQTQAGSIQLTSNGYLFSSTSSAVLAPGTGDFTIEAWIWPQNISSWLAIFQNDQVGGSSSDKFYFAWNQTNSRLTLGQHSTSNTAYCSWSPIINRWYHLAATRQSGTVNIFINGVLQSVTNPTQFNGTSFGQNGWAAGAISTPYYMPGYITGVRYVVGTAVYTASFTLPSAPLSPVSGTQVLLNTPTSGTAFTDGSPNRWTVSTSGTATFNNVWTPLPTAGQSARTVLLYNSASNGNTYGIIPQANSNNDFLLNQFGIGNLFITTSGLNTARLNVWQHVALVRRGISTTLYVGGVNVGSTVLQWWPNSPTQVFWGGNSGAFASYFTGNISNFRMVMGTAVYTSNFTPPTQPLTAVQGTALLSMNSSTVIDNSGNAWALTNNATVTMAATTPSPFVANVTMDASGNFNNWIPNVIGMLSGAGYDSMNDSPSDSNVTVGSYAVVNLNNSSIYSAANFVSFVGLRMTGGGTGAWNNALPNVVPASGKWYYEVTVTTATINYQGASVFQSIMTTTNLAGSASTAPGWSIQTGVSGQNTNYWNANTGTAVTMGTFFSSGDIINVAVDIGAGKVWFGRNGVWYNISGTSFTNTDVAAGNGFAFSNLAQNVPTYMTASVYQTGVVDLNYGQRPFTYTAPSGFNPVNTFNLAAPTQYFWGPNTATTPTYPDLVWLKSRSTTGSHELIDTVRGPSIAASSDKAQPQFGTANGVSINRYGINLGNDGNANTSGTTYVAWGWQAGQGNVVLNTNGTVASNVSVNPSAGFSITTFQASSSVQYNFGHGLGVTPSFWIIKPSNTANSWYVWHSSLAFNQYLLLNSTAAAVTDSTIWNAPATSSVINLGTGWVPSAAQQPWYGLAYVWAAVPGYSAFGSYTGNNNADGPFVYTGFRPRYILLKQSDAVRGWFVHDTIRSPYNPMIIILDPTSNAGDNTNAAWSVDVVSNGFKIRTTDTGFNASTGNYIYAAFAENPFKYALAR